MMLVVVVGSRGVMVVPEVPGGLQPVPDHFLHSKDLASAVARIGESRLFIYKVYHNITCCNDKYNSNFSYFVHF